jgi:Double-GTPase 2
VPDAQFVCSKDACTFAVTGTCLEAIENPTEKCPNLRAISAQALPSLSPSRPKSTTESDGIVRRFPTGLEIGLEDASRLMQGGYARLVGILGQANAGKTSLLASLYLNLAARALPPHRFAGSLTLLGFEHRARHLRNWSYGGLPEQIVDHTVLGDSRVPAFLHLSVHSKDYGTQQLLLPDLPGEWTSQLISNAGTIRKFRFIQRADVVLIVLEAPLFAEHATRHSATTDAVQLIARLADDVHLPTSIPLIFALRAYPRTLAVRKATMVN